MNMIVAFLAAPFPALPLEIFRVLAGGILLVYFLNALRQSRDFSDPGGLIDHRLVARLLPPTRLGLFQPGMPGRLIRSVHICACAAALLVMVGVYPRAAAAFLFLVAVSSYRWNVLVAYLDDCIVHLACLWLVLLPVGSTLTPFSLPGRAATATDWSAMIADWSHATVPGLAPRAFMANMALVYLVAGLYKFTSPMWRNGSAMHAALKMPIARTPEFWSMRHRHPLRAITWAALVLEPLFVLIYLLPAGTPAKWTLASCAVIFHLGIIATLKIPYSNALMTAALIVPLAPELLEVVGNLAGSGSFPHPADPSALAAVPVGQNDLGNALAAALVALLAIMFPWEAVGTGRQVGKPYSRSGWANPLRAFLWIFGLFQSYRLFDWVDARNYHVRYEVRRLGSTAPTRIDPHSLFPNSMRHLLLQSYLVGNIWLQMDREMRRAVRHSLLVRHAARFARAHPDAGEIEVFAIVQRITSDNLQLTRGERRPLMRFTCTGGRAVMHCTADSASGGCASAGTPATSGNRKGT